MASSLQYSWLISSLNTITTTKPTSCRHSTASIKPLFATSSGEPSPEKAPESPPVLDPVKLAFEKAKAYKKLSQSSSKSETEQTPVQDSAGDGGKKEDPVSIKVGIEKGFKQGITQNEEKKEKLTISSIDFVGLNFADKKIGRGLPPGLIQVQEQFSEGDLSAVEIIVGDTSNFNDTKTSNPKPVKEDNPDLYKPKVSTWGVFPRPANISKTFGGGKVIRPGDVLETAADRAAKDERTRQLLTDYNKKAGLFIEPKLKSECEKALKDGDILMDSGNLEAALPYYQNVMDKLPFKSQLYGLAALQWSICQDSLNRQKEARVMYEKLQSHPYVKVSKRAREFTFTFRAMEMMKFTSPSSSSSSRNTEYENFFEAFIDDKTNFTRQESELEEARKLEETLNQTLPYVIFLISPIVMVLVLAIQKGSIQ